MSINSTQNSQKRSKKKLEHEYYMTDIKKALKSKDQESYFEKLAKEHFKQVHQTFAAFKGDPLLSDDEIDARKVYLPTTSKQIYKKHFG